MMAELCRFGLVAAVLALIAAAGPAAAGQTPGHRRARALCRRPTSDR